MCDVGAACSPSSSLCQVRRLTDAVLVSLNDDSDTLYAAFGRPSIAPGCASGVVAKAFYLISSEWQLVEQLDYNLLFGWFVGLGMDDAVWNHAVLSKNRDRLLTSEVAPRFFAEVNRLARRFISDDHFTVEGTLIQPGPRKRASAGRMDRMTARAPTSVGRGKLPRLYRVDHRSGVKAPQEELWQGVESWRN